MKGMKKAIGPVGLLLVLVGGVTYGILYSSGWISIVPLLAGLALLVASIVISYRESKTDAARRSTRFGINTGIAIIFFTAILIFLQTISSRQSVRIDTTSNRRFSLSPQTAKVLGGLDREVSFTCFFKETGSGKQELEDLLAEYRGTSGYVRYRFIDPDRNPVEARRYDITSYGTIIAESGEMQERFTEITENALTNTILKVTREQKKVVYFVTGHGEKSIEDSEPSGFGMLKEAILGENYEVRTLLLMREERVPEDCEMFVIAGPEQDLFPGEREIIETYLTGGGNILLLIDPLTDIPLIADLISAYGIELGEDIVVDRFGRLVAGNFLTPIVNSYSEHVITEGFRMASIYPQARSIREMPEKPEGVTVSILGTTGTSAYAETNLDTLIEAGKTQFEGEYDLVGPINIAAAATRQLGRAQVEDAGMTGTRSSRLVLFGDSDFASNANFNLSGNRDLILNTVSWLAEEEDLISIRPREGINQPVLISARAGRVVFWLPVIGLPALVGIIGVMVAIRRRRSA